MFKVWGWESITYLSCNKTLQWKCGYYTKPKTEATECCQVIISAVVLKNVSWNVEISDQNTFWVL